MLADAFYSSLAHPSRREIIRVLTENPPLSAGSLAARVGVSRSNLSAHLRPLRESRVVRWSRRGNVIMYTVDQEVLAACLRETAESLNVSLEES
ncbi:ArsR/SmtB family transcription factor [Nocardiopsis ganjiahuensis]|uniref:ArsR/SmtB family transcription factor n=1 Tax=Nocardiopsis ganjiahuensis TaxID=239984 RepID=UPI000345AFD5|nr:metalloregulator ArsR/SmtB family transcription factor [Nocardiopsis ganjiahuensis]